MKKPLEGLMLFQEGFPAKTLAAQGKLEGLLRESGQAYGAKLKGLLAKLDPSTQLWKMSQTCLLESGELGLENYSQTWSKSGIMLSGIAYELTPLDCPMKEIGFGLLPTPTKSDGSNPSLKQQLRLAETWKNNSSLSAIIKGLFLGLKGKERNRTTYVVNPCLPEMMMGFPDRWTELEHVETQ